VSRTPATGWPCDATAAFVRQYATSRIDVIRVIRHIRAATVGRTGIGRSPRATTVDSECAMTIESPPRHPRVATARGAARTNSCLSARVALPAAALSAVLSAVLICPSSLASQATVQATVQGPARWNVETPTGPSRTVVFEAHEGTLMSLAISPDGQSIAFDLLGAIYELPIAGGSARRLTSGRSWNLFPRYSPDGRSIAFSSDRNGSYDVWVMNREGGALERLDGPARSERASACPAWSTDGRRLYAVRSGDGIATQLVALDRIGGRQVPEEATLIAEPGALLSSATVDRCMPSPSSVYPAQRARIDATRRRVR
jgi:dipeptidyl aminopeptidase/acylaminoacyl peptidase